MKKKPHPLLDTTEILCYQLQGTLAKNGLNSASFDLLGKFASAVADSKVITENFTLNAVWSKIKDLSQTVDKWTRLRTFIILTEKSSKDGSRYTSIFNAMANDELKSAAAITIDSQNAAADLEQSLRFYRKFAHSDDSKKIVARIVQNFAEAILNDKVTNTADLKESAEQAITELKEDGNFKEPPRRPVLSLKKRTPEGA